MFHLSFGLSVCTCRPSPKRRVSRGTTDNCQERISSHLWAYEKDWRTMWHTITILLPYSIIPSNQANGKYPPSLTMMMICLVHLLGISNIPTTIIQYSGWGAHPGSSAVPTGHYFLSLVTIILSRYWILHARTSKIFCYYKANFVPDGFGKCLKYSHTTHENKFYCRDHRHLNLSKLYIDFIVFFKEY